MEVSLLDNYIVEHVRKVFPDTLFIILWGSITLPNFSPEWGDVDTLIVLDKLVDPVDVVRNNLYKITELLLEKGIKFDPGIVTTTDIKNTDFPMVKIEGIHESHSLIQYQIKYMGKVIFGSNKILETIPEITLSQAISDISPYILENLAIKTENELEGVSDIYNFIVERKGNFFILARTLYTVVNHEITTKPNAAKFLASEYPQFKSLGTLLQNIYEKENKRTDIQKEEVESFLKLMEEKLKQ